MSGLRGELLIPQFVPTGRVLLVLNQRELADQGWGRTGPPAGATLIEAKHTQKQHVPLNKHAQALGRNANNVSRSSFKCMWSDICTRKERGPLQPRLDWATCVCLCPPVHHGQTVTGWSTDMNITGRQRVCRRFSWVLRVCVCVCFTPPCDRGVIEWKQNRESRRFCPVQWLSVGLSWTTGNCTLRYLKPHLMWLVKWPTLSSVYNLIKL